MIHEATILDSLYNPTDSVIRLLSARLQHDSNLLATLTDKLSDTLLFRTADSRTVLDWVVAFNPFWAVLLSVGVTIGIFLWQRRKEALSLKRQSERAWRVLLAEVAAALNRMRTTAIAVMGADSQGKRLPESEIFLVPAVLSEFLESVDDADSAVDVLFIYENLHQFRWNIAGMHEARTSLATLPAAEASKLSLYEHPAKTKLASHGSAAAWFATRRHHLMIDRFNECVGRYRAFCDRKPKVTASFKVPEMPKLGTDLQRDEYAEAKLSTGQPG